MSSYQQRPQQSPELAPVEADLDLLDVGKVLLGQASGGNGALLDLLGLRSAAETSAQRGQVEMARETGRDLVDGAAERVTGALSGGRQASWELSPAFGLFSELLWEPAETTVEAAAGFAKGGLDLGADLAQVRVDPLSTLSGLASMNAALPVPINPFRAGRELLQARAGEGSYTDALRSLVDPSVSAVEDQTFWRGVGQGALQPYEEAWSNGKPGEISGRLLLDVGPDLLGAGLGAKALGVANKVSDVTKGVTGAGFLSEELEQLIRPSVGRLNANLKSGPLNANKVVEGAQLQDAATFYRDWYKTPGARRLTPEAAAREAEGMYAYVRRSDPEAGTSTGLVFRDDIPPELRAEIVQHEVNHLAASPGLRDRSGLMLDEAITTYLTSKQLGKPPLGYPNLAALAERYAGEVGFEELMEVFTSQGVSALGDALKARGRGNGIQLRVELHQAMEKDLEL